MSDIERMKVYQTSRGFPSSVEPETTLHSDKKTIDVTLKIAPEGRP